MSHQPDFLTKLERALALTATALSIGSYGRVFRVANDILFLYSQVATSVFTSLCSEIEGILAFSPQSPKNIYNEFSNYRLFDLGQEISRLVDGVRRIISETDGNTTAMKPPIDVRQLEYLCDSIKKSDIRSVIFNQPVYYIAHQVPSIEFIEFYTSISNLEGLFVPDHSIMADPWLFGFIKHDLDTALMKAIVKDLPEYRHRAFSINLLTTTFLSERFGSFLHQIPSRLSGKIYVEIDKTDILHHSHRMADVFKRSQKLGVPICIEGLSHHDIAFLKLAGTAFDHVKIKWDDRIAALDSGALDAFIRELAAIKAKIVLTRCDSSKALTFAKAMGINYVQGRLADQHFKFGASLGGTA